MRAIAASEWGGGGSWNGDGTILFVRNPAGPILRVAEKFAANAGYTRGAFIGWRTFNAFVAELLPLGDPLDFRPFDA